jgi:hypothetical protein
MQRTQKLSTLIDIDPSRLLSASGVRPSRRLGLIQTAVSIPGLTGGNGSLWFMPTPAQLGVAAEKKAENDFRASLVDLMNYNEVRGQGRSGLTTRQQPSNPHAFVRPLAVKPRRPSDVLNAHQLAETIGITDGDRRFFAQSLASAIEQLPKPKPKAATLAKELFASAPFKDFIAGGPMPDRDEFKDRFVEALNEVLTKRGIDAGFAPDRTTYASGPRYDPKAVEEKESAIMPTSACLRCHQVAEYGKAIRFDLIPPLAFDPFDKLGREAWLRRTADAKKRHDVLKRMMTRLATDADMPPEDAPELDLFRVKKAASFAEVKQFLTAHLGKSKKP